MLNRLDDLRLARPLLSKMPGTFRVLFLGDSTGMPQGVRAHEGTALLLEQSLNRLLIDRNVEVINRSVGGLNFHHYALYAERMTAEIQPDLVLFYLCPNDTEIYSLPLPALTKETAELQWGASSPYLPHFRAAASQVAQHLKDLPVVLFGINYLDLFCAADMDAVLRDTARELGWHYATTYGQFRALPFERLVGTTVDHHPSGYVHHVAANQICQLLSRDLKLHRSNKPLDPAALLSPLLARVLALPIESAAFYQELLRLFDLTTQKANHLRKSITNPGAEKTADLLAAVRLHLIATINRYLATCAAVTQTRGHETNLPRETFAIQMFQHLKLFHAEIGDSIARRLDANPPAPGITRITFEPDPDPAAADALLAQAKAALNQITHFLSRFESAPPAAPAVNPDLPADIRAMLHAIDTRIADYTDDRLFRIRDRQADIAELLKEACAHGFAVVRRVERLRREKINTGDRYLAALRSLADYNNLVQLLGGPNLQYQEIGLPTKALWSPDEWLGYEAAPLLSLKLDIQTARPNAAGLWIDAVTPHAFYADYQQTHPDKLNYEFTFPFATEFHLKLAASHAFSPSAAALSLDGHALPSQAWIKISDNLYRSQDFYRLTPDVLPFTGAPL